jgi:hypothetical protein
MEKEVVVVVVVGGYISRDALGALHFFSYPNHEMWQKKEIRIKENV